MLRNTLSSILVSVANQYAELSPSDVGIGIGGGRLVIDDVKLRADTFNGPNIPFHVYEGRAGRLRVDVPWSALSSSPLKVYMENVHLLAGPKLEQHSQSQSQSNSSKTSTLQKPIHSWHQTIVGRLLFNVSVEIFGLNVEYRDEQCIGIFSLASLAAFSAGPDWQQRFVSLVPDRDDDAQLYQGNAVTMRKLVKLTGVHCVMIPRRSINEDDTVDDRRLDLKSFESSSPILDGVSIDVKVLVCTGSALVSHLSNDPIPGMHMEIDVDIEEPKLNLTARQLAWINHIIEHSFGNAQTKQEFNQQININTKRRPRSQPITPTKTENANIKSNVKKPISVRNDNLNPVADKEDLNHDNKLTQNNENIPNPQNSINPMNSLANDSNDLNDEDLVEDPHSSYDFDDSFDGDYPLSPGESSRNPFASLWQAIISENGDETIDDAAYALGLSEIHSELESTDENDLDVEESEIDIYARKAVTAAAHAGGFTLKVRLVTPDVKAWDRIEKLEEELAHEREMRQKLEDLENTLLTAENLVKEHEERARQLQQKNDSLVTELRDLEVMASKSGKNKDAMIRQTEAALTKAERNLQALLQERYREQYENNGHGRREQGIQASSELIENQPETTMESETGTNGFTVESTSNTVIVHANTESSEQSDASFVKAAKENERERSIPIVETSGSHMAESEEDVSAPILKDELDQQPLSEVDFVDKSKLETNYQDAVLSKNFSKVEQAISSDGLTLI